ncbi:MAG: hypothetical protein LUH82_07380 [Clostridiales bacterium]|nr:hypothetical protein [Clostridiales bacterium]
MLVYREWGREWQKYDYNVVGNQIYYENSQGYWSKSEYDADGNETCYENSEGLKIGNPHTSTDSVIDNVQSM